MTGRERIEKTIKGEKTDRVAWSTIIDEVTKTGMDPESAKMDSLSLYRKIGCDILIFGNYFCPEAIRPEAPFKLSVPFEYSSFMEGDVVSFERRLGKKKLSGITRNNHPIKYPVETKEDAETLLKIWSETQISPVPDYLDSARTVEAAIGDDGVFALTLHPSPIQTLIEEECGEENFYYLMQDEEELMDVLIHAMYRIRKKEYEIAAGVPYCLVIPVENTSSTLVSPAFYRKYSLEHIRDYVSCMHANGKKAVVHMCGHLKALLNEIKETGMDGIHALTEPPVGTCTFEEALDFLGDDLVIIGCLDPCVFLNPNSTSEEIDAAVKKVLTGRVRESNLILGAGADGIPTPLWKYEAVSRAVEKYGVRN